MELIRPIVKVGNSAGVILPKEWLRGKAKISLIARPLDIKKEVFDILEDYLGDIKGIYLAGSYARKEETENSDVDIIAITNKTNEKINNGKYEIILISENRLKEILKENVLPILPMLKEAETILNKELITEYKETKISYKNLKFHIETTKSILNVNRVEIEMNKNEGRASDAVAYSLILRAREIYIVDCMNKGDLWSNKKFLKLIKNIAGSLKAYEGYLRVKNNLSTNQGLPIGEAEKLYYYVDYKIREQEKWLRKRK